ncbi:MAG: helix-turn-helix transcriptional regulator [Roseicyclus sp.]|nr:helix-turn-helix transcriptional regulator [Roseicyclus sp.]
MDENTALVAFGALSNATRLKIVRLLVEAGPDGLPAGDVAKAAGASPSRASFHLAGLANAGLVTADRQARTIFYRVSFEQLGALMAFVLNDCCKGHPIVQACCGQATASC